MEAFSGNFNINYTNKNDRQILDIQKNNKFTRIELFMSKVEKYIIDIEEM
jgi:hypothetical protein